MQCVAGGIDVFRIILRTDAYTVGTAVYGNPVEVFVIVGVSHRIPVVGIGIERLRHSDPLGEFSARNGEVSGTFAGGFIGLRFERHGNAAFSGRCVDIEPFGVGRDDIPPVCKYVERSFRTGIQHPGLDQLHLDLAHNEPVCGIFRLVLDAGGKQTHTAR